MTDEIFTKKINLYLYKSCFNNFKVMLVKIEKNYSSSFILHLIIIPKWLKYWWRDNTPKIKHQISKLFNNNYKNDF